MSCTTSFIVSYLSASAFPLVVPPVPSCLPPSQSLFRSNEQRILRNRSPKILLALLLHSKSSSSSLESSQLRFIAIVVTFFYNRAPAETRRFGSFHLIVWSSLGRRCVQFAHIFIAYSCAACFCSVRKLHSLSLRLAGLCSNPPPPLFRCTLASAAATQKYPRPSGALF